MKTKLVTKQIYNNAKISSLINGMLDCLPKEQQDCTRMFYIEEKNQDQIVKELGISLRTVESRLSKGKEQIGEMVLEYQNFQFVLELLVDPEEGTKLLFVYPKTTNRKIDRKITDRFTDKMFESRFFMDNRPEMYIQQCIATNHVCYSDNLTATDFNNVISQMDL